jgi:hypothetical protein
MLGTIRRTRGSLAAGFSLCTIFLLARCSEGPLTTESEALSAAHPRATVGDALTDFDFLQPAIIDVDGANDTPAQSDLNSFTRADNVGGWVAVQWTWDDVNSWTGAGQTGDACALFDITPITATKGKGNADHAVCVRISNTGGNPEVIEQLNPGSPLLYSCGDTKTDRCASQATLISTGNSGDIECVVEKIAGEPSFPGLGEDNAETQATCRIRLSVLGTSVQPNLLNVCSFPSGSPNSNPFDCVVRPSSGFLQIKKATTPQSSGATFSFTATPGGTKTITDNSNTDESATYAVAPGTFSVTEGTLTGGWQLDAIVCEIQTTPTSTATGTANIGTRTVSGVSVTTGETTICTYTNSVPPDAPVISVTKSVDEDSISANGGTAPGNFTPDASFARGSGGGTGSGSNFAASLCDDAGPNDVPSQVDLNCMSRADNIAGRIGVRWTWDDIDVWGGSNTGDACALLDTNNDGKANFALCDRINVISGQLTQIATILYSCKNQGKFGEVDRCFSSEPVTVSSTSCSISNVSEGFPGQGEDGSDTQAECSVLLTELGTNVNIANVDLINVCSYPSGSPNSNPFDCVVRAGAGFLVIVKSTTPSSDSYFGFQLRNASNTADAIATNGQSKWSVQGGATSAAIPVDSGSYALTELLPTNWSLASINCVRDAQSTGSRGTGGSSNTQLNFSILRGQTTTCTYNNTLGGSGLVTFTVVVSNDGTGNVTLTSLTDSAAYDPATASHASLSGAGTCNTGSNLFGTITPGNTYTCAFTRTISGAVGTRHRDRVKAVASNAASQTDTKRSNTVTVEIIE